MITCSSCQGETCTYGPNRRGTRTTTCCVCARQQGWSGYVALACSPCRMAQADPLHVLSVEDAANADCKSIVETQSDFRHAVRELRQKRMLKMMKWENDSTSSFKEAYDLLRFRRLHGQTAEGQARPSTEIRSMLGKPTAQASEGAAASGSQGKDSCLPIYLTSKTHRALQPITSNSPRAARC